MEIYESTPEGKKITIDMLQPGDIFGYANINSDQNNIKKQFIRASNDVTLCIMPRNDFLLLLEQKPDLALRIIKELSSRLTTTESKLRDTALSDVETRVLLELNRLWQRYGTCVHDKKYITRKFTHEELAHFVGTARETVSRTLTRLTEKQKISIDSSGNIALLQ